MEDNEGLPIARVDYHNETGTECNEGFHFSVPYVLWLEDHYEQLKRSENIDSELPLSQGYVNQDDNENISDN